MALRTIRVMGDEILTKQCRPVKEMTPRIKTLLEDMLETMYDAEGVGLAAPQVGILKQICVIDVTPECDLRSYWSIRRSLNLAESRSDRKAA